MQRKAQVLKTFLREKVGLKPGTGTEIINGLNSIPAPGVPGLQYPISVLQTTNAKLITTSAEAATGSHAGKAGRDAAEKDWNIKFGATADSVNDWADGDEQKILQTGFKSSKTQTEPAHRLHAPGNLERTPGPAAAAVSVDTPDNGHADAFVFVAAPVEAAISRNGDTICINMGGQQVYVHVDTHRGANLEGLAPGIDLQIMAAAVNSAGTSDMSNMVKVTPQSIG